MDPDPRFNHDGDPDLSPCHDLDRNLAMHDALTVMEIRVRETAMIRIQPFQLSLTGIRIWAYIMVRIRNCAGKYCMDADLSFNLIRIRVADWCGSGSKRQYGGYPDWWAPKTARTVLQRSLHPIYVLIYYIKWVKTYWTCSIIGISAHNTFLC